MKNYDLRQSGAEVQELLDQVPVNKKEIERLKQLYAGLSKTDVEIVAALPEVGVANTIYRVTGSDGYADYMFDADDLSTAILLATYGNGIDEEPVANSKNLVESGGVEKVESEIVQNIVSSIGESVLFVLNGNIYSTDYIDVTDSIFVYRVHVNSSFEYISFYDTNKNYISGFSKSGDVDFEGYILKYPTNTKYVVFKSSSFKATSVKKIKQNGGILWGQASGISDTTYLISTGIYLKAGITYSISVKTEELITTIGDKGIYLYPISGGDYKFVSVDVNQMYNGITLMISVSIDSELRIRTYETNIHWYVDVKMSIMDYLPTLSGKIDGEISDIDERLDDLETDMAKLESLDGKVYYDAPYSLAGNNTALHYAIITTIIPTGSETILYAESGNITTDWGNLTIIQFCFMDSSDGYIKRITIRSNGILEEEIPSNCVKIEVRFYSTSSIYDKDTTGYTYSVDNLNIYIPSIRSQADDNTLAIKELQQSILNINGFWKDKNVVVWGDSITAQGNGDTPTTNSYMYWAAIAHQFAHLYVRGIGGQTYIWNTSGWYCKAQGGNGNYVNRYKFDSQGQQLNQVVSPVNVTAEEIANIENHYGYSIEVHYGSFCSWDRIKAMIPSSIRETIDLVILCGGTNDFSAVEEVEVEGDMSAAEPDWIANDATDPTWAADTTYYKGGDYDITTFSGAVASTIMKMQVWCPNAVVVLATPFPRFNLTTKEQYQNSSNLKFRRMCEIESEIAGFVGVDVIDANGKCNINGVNYVDFQTDGVHPNLAGRKMFGKVFVGELERISTKI